MFDNEKRILIYEWEELITNEKCSGLSYARDSNNTKECFKIIWNYVITDVLKWTPEQAVKYLSKEVIIKMKLWPTLKLIDFDPSKVYVGDMRKLLQYVFPDKVKYDFRKDTIDSYNRSICAEQFLYTEKEKKALPRSFWADADGEKRAAIIMNYLTSKYLGDMTVREKYEFFATKKKSVKWLKDNNIYGAIGTVYDTPLELYHETASSEYKNDDLYFEILSRKDENNTDEDEDD